MLHASHLPDVRGFAGVLPQLTARAGISSRERIRRESGISINEALALAAFRRHVYERRSGKDAPTHKYEGNRGRPKTKPSTAVYDARIVRGIDFERCLAAIGPFAATILRLYYVDGEGYDVVSAATDRSLRSLGNDLAEARHALALELEKADLI